MPQNGISSEWIEQLEDEIAQLLTARDQVERLRRLGDLLYRRRMISTAYYRDLRDALDYIAAALLTAKRRVAQLRNGGRDGA